MSGKRCRLRCPCFSIACAKRRRCRWRSVSASPRATTSHKCRNSQTGAHACCLDLACRPMFVVFACSAQRCCRIGDRELCQRLGLARQARDRDSGVRQVAALRLMIDELSLRASNGKLLSAQSVWSFVWQAGSLRWISNRAIRGLSLVRMQVHLFCQRDGSFARAALIACRCWRS